MNGQPFSEAQIALIRARYPTEGAAPLVQEIQRDRKSITQKARMLGLRVAGRQPHGRMGRGWTEEEDRWLRQEWPRVQRRQQSAIRVAERIGVSVQQARRRAADLGLHQPFQPFGMWTTEEDELLAANGHLALPALVRRFQRAGYRRTEAALAKRRVQLSVKALGNGSYYSARELAMLLGVSVTPVLRWIRQGWLPARQRGEAVNAQGGPGDRYLIAPKDVREFIINYTAHVATALATADKHWLVDLLAGRYLE